MPESAAGLETRTLADMSIVRIIKSGLSQESPQESLTIKFLNLVSTAYRA